jgi:hypothetical protein
MSGSRVTGSRRAGLVVTVLMLFALVVLMLAVALPAQAASTKVKSGSTQPLVKANVVTHLQSMGVGIYAIPPVTFQPRWVSGGLQWWYRVSMASGGTYDFSAKKGVFYHSGSLRWVEASTATHNQVRWEGLRVLALGKSSYQLSAAVGITSPLTRMTVATATNTPTITKNGKAIKIDGVQFKLTPAGETALFNALGVHVSTSLILFDTDLLFNMK